MTKKNNIRSIRISDDMAALIEQQVGNNFTEKWENLVTRCVWELPKKEEQLKQTEARVQNERSRIIDLIHKRQQLESSILRLQSTLDREIRSLEQM